MSTEAATVDTSDLAARWRAYGHGEALASLCRAVETGRLAHAFLVTGPPGVGKTTLATRLAQALCCETPRDDRAPCFECRSCRQVESGESPDIERIAIGGVCDEANHDHGTDRSTRIRICQVRRLERVSALAPFRAPRRIFVVDTADDLQPEAAHALLKTLEEPAANSLLVLLATDADALLPTVRSRCQLIELRPMSPAALARALVEHAEVEEEDAPALASMAQGRYGLAMRIRRDPSLRVLHETAVAEAARLAREGRNARLDYADSLAGSWQRERESVIATLDAWAGWWRARLHEAAGLQAAKSEPEATPAQAVLALRAIRQAREHLLANVNAQLAIEVMMLDLPRLAGKEARAAAPTA